MIGSDIDKEQEFNDALQQRERPFHFGTWILIGILVIVGVYLIQKFGVINKVLVATNLSDTKTVVLGGTKVKVGYPKEYVQLNKDVANDTFGVYWLSLTQSESCREPLTYQTSDPGDCIQVIVMLKAIEMVNAEDDSNSSAFVTKSDYVSQAYSMEGKEGTYESFTSNKSIDVFQLEPRSHHYIRFFVPHPKYKGFYFYVAASTTSESQTAEQERVVKYIIEHSQL